MPHVIAFNGSPRKNGNTGILIRLVFEELEKEGISCECVQIGGVLLHGCQACGACRRSPGACVFTDDPVNDWIARLVKADGFLLASPTYFANVTAEMKAFIDRAGYVTGGMGNILAGKAGAPITVARRGGAMQAYNALMAFFGVRNVVVPASSYWNLAYGNAPGDVLKDAEGVATMRRLGQNMGRLLKVQAASQA